MGIPRLFSFGSKRDLFSNVEPLTRFFFCRRICSWFTDRLLEDRRLSCSVPSVLFRIFRFPPARTTLPPLPGLSVGTSLSFLFTITSFFSSFHERQRTAFSAACKIPSFSFSPPGIWNPLLPPPPFPPGPGRTRKRVCELFFCSPFFQEGLSEEFFFW